MNKNPSRFINIATDSRLTTTADLCVGRNEKILFHEHNGPVFLSYQAPIRSKHIHGAMPFLRMISPASDIMHVRIIVEMF